MIITKLNEIIRDGNKMLIEFGEMFQIDEKYESIDAVLTQSISPKK